MSAGRPGRCEAAVFVAVVAAGIGLAAAGLDDPLRGDEAITAASYAFESFGHAATKIDRLNNHVFHTLLVWAADRAAGPGIAALRIPAFLAWCLLLPAVWWFVRGECGWTAAAFATTFAATSRFLLEHAAVARGYTILLLLFVLALRAGRGLLRTPDNHLLWGAWAAALALGFFTIRLMVFPAAIVVAWMLLTRWREGGVRGLGSFAVRTGAWSAVALVAGLALYLPAMAFEGPGALFAHHSFGQYAVDRTAPGFYAQRVLWRQWHVATPMWLQAALAVFVVAGAVARSPVGAVARFPVGAGAHAPKPTRPGGRLLAATYAGSLAVLLAVPVLLQGRFAVWALLALLLVAGHGAAFVVDVLRVGRIDRRRVAEAAPSPRANVVRGCAVVLVLVACASVARLPVPAGPRPWWPVRSFPAAPTLAQSVAGQLRAGDCLAVPLNADILQWYVMEGMSKAYLRADGVELSKSSRSCPLFGGAESLSCDSFGAGSSWSRGVPDTNCQWLTRQVAAPSTPPPVFGGPEAAALVVLDAGFRSRDRNMVGDLEVRAHLETSGLRQSGLRQYEVVVDLAGGRAYRLPEWLK